MPIKKIVMVKRRKDLTPEQFRDGYLARGGQIHTDIVASDDGGQFLVLSDPDGNLLKVVQATG